MTKTVTKVTTAVIFVTKLSFRDFGLERKYVAITMHAEIATQNPSGLRQYMA